MRRGRNDRWRRKGEKEVAWDKERRSRRKGKIVLWHRSKTPLVRSNVGAMVHSLGYVQMHTRGGIKETETVCEIILRASLEARKKFNSSKVEDACEYRLKDFTCKLLEMLPFSGGASLLPERCNIFLTFLWIPIYFFSMCLQIFKGKEWKRIKERERKKENSQARLMKDYRRIDVEELFVEDVYWVRINLRSELYFILNFLLVVSEILCIPKVWSRKFFLELQPPLLISRKQREEEFDEEKSFCTSFFIVHTCSEFLVSLVILTRIPCFKHSLYIDFEIQKCIRNISNVLHMFQIDETSIIFE